MGIFAKIAADEVNNTVEQLTENVSPEEAKGLFSRIGDSIGGAWDWTKDKASKGYNWTKGKASKGYNWTKEHIGNEWAHLKNNKLRAALAALAAGGAAYGGYRYGKKNK